MTTQTITEALAEIKTIGKRLIKKREFINQYVARQAVVRDPLLTQGGSVAVIAAERQAVHDLESRIVALRLAINAASVATTVTVGGEEHTIAWWLTWRREVVPARIAGNQLLQRHFVALRAQAQKDGMTLHPAAPADPQEKDVVINLNERELAAEVEKMEEVLGTLDVLLSLKNATITITA